ncbi:MAG: SCO family protein [Deltaproteobacteria bacterium]|nr:MAG: SCO family protein [Deltaproteobacteria bacterium]
MIRRDAAAIALVALLGASASSRAPAHEPDDAAPPPKASESLRFEAPPPGSYELPPIQRVSDYYPLLAHDGTREPLLGLASDQVALVSFAYLDCTDATGCPLALATLKRLDHALAERPALAGRARLVTLSIDPARDTPERMAAARRHLAPVGDWRFLTLETPEALAAVLADFGQDAVRLRGPDGGDSGRIRHVLKVFLVDAKGDVRNIYSAGFLFTPILLNDIETVLADAAPQPRAERGARPR